MRQIICSNLKLLSIVLLLIFPVACARAQQREGRPSSEKGTGGTSQDARIRPPEEVKCPTGTSLTFWEGRVDSFERSEGQTKITVVHDDSGVSYTGVVKHEGDEPPVELFRVKNVPFREEDWSKVEIEKNRLKPDVRARVWICTDRNGQALTVQRIDWLLPGPARPKTKSKP